MIGDLELLDNLRTLASPIYVKLPDGIYRPVTTIRNINFGDKNILKDVLYIPEFQNNLLLVGKLVEETDFLAVCSRRGFTF